MGTPDFAVPALKALYNSHHKILAVITQPDRPKGRGRKLTPSPVKKEALKCGYDIIQPDSVRTEEFINSIKRYQPDFIVVIAFGHILPQQILDFASKGAINVHASLLPQYRGPAPIQWAIIKGEEKTGVTTMKMDAGMDTGDILLTAETNIAKEDTAASLHDRLAQMGADLLLQTLNKLQSDGITPKAQDHGHATYAPMLSKNDGHIDWNKPARELEVFIRGVTPWPGAFTFFNNRRLKLFKTKPVNKEIAASPGTVLKTFPGELYIATGKGALSIIELQGASGKRLPIDVFLRGCEIPVGTILT